MGTLDESLAVVLEEIAKRIAVHVAAHMANGHKDVAAHEHPHSTRTDVMHTAALPGPDMDDAPRRRGRPKKRDQSAYSAEHVAAEHAPAAEHVAAEHVAAEHVAAEHVAAEHASAELAPARQQGASDTAFSYDTLKAAVIELANIVPDGRSKVLDIFTEHKVPGNKAQNADPSLWPVLYAAVIRQLEAMKQRVENLSDDDEFTF